MEVGTTHNGIRLFKGAMMSELVSFFLFITSDFNPYSMFTLIFIDIASL